MARPPNYENEPSSKSSNKFSDSSNPKTAGSSHPELSESILKEIHFLSLFPEAIKPHLETSLLGKAQERGLVQYHFTQIRDFAMDAHRKVDDLPFGGGEGMLLKCDVLYRAWETLPVLSTGKRPYTLLLSPQGKVLDQALAKDLVNRPSIALVCGHYEGVDQRFIDLSVDLEVSIGDYVLTGGELPALVVADAVTRLIPGVVGNERSVALDSLESGLLKYPQYTRPREFMGRSVPDVLLGGNHREIEKWRAEQSREVTRTKRPDLWRKLMEND